eukprot:gnl/TRDRNA2_/TRDRNA2_175620_c1_seq4.p2 gnl/TRDRNA2_/TRDRNA2_175620_c1~~gnl/TRDRNA2_/TRDRNA2_175620_c1_seq4.p2  ORF type:complete len:110 (+),score=21.04 gnl/TRDRNA2_/TRDRNA2_175620_c1_seq4:3-332(+)
MYKKCMEHDTSGEAIRRQSTSIPLSSCCGTEVDPGEGVWKPTVNSDVGSQHEVDLPPSPLIQALDLHTGLPPSVQRGTVRIFFENGSSATTKHSFLHFDDSSFLGMDGL